MKAKVFFIMPLNCNIWDGILLCIPGWSIAQNRTASVSQVPRLHMQCHRSQIIFIFIFPLLLFSKFNILTSHLLGLTGFPPHSLTFLRWFRSLIYFVCVSVHTSYGMPVEVREQTAGATSPFRCWDPEIWVTRLSGQCPSHWAIPLTLTC